jgi:hypothetical protein
MRKGFFLTESERNRISNLYGGNKIFLLEATAPPPTTKEERVEFSKWMDTKHPNWVTLNNRGKKGNSPGTRAQSDPFNSGSWTRAWDKYGDEYLKEKGTSSNPDDQWYVWDDTNKKHEGPFTKEQIIEKAKQNPEIQVSNKNVTGNQYRVAKNIPELGLPMAPGGSFTSKTGTDISQYGNFEGTKIGRRETEIDRYYKNKGENKEPLDNMLYRQKSVQGFQDWAKRTMNGIVFSTDPQYMKLEGNKLTTNEGGIERTYYYDEKAQEWKHPMMDNHIKIIVQPGPKQGP